MTWFVGLFILTPKLWMQKLCDHISASDSYKMNTDSEFNTLNPYVLCKSNSIKKNRDYCKKTYLNFWVKRILNKYKMFEKSQIFKEAVNSHEEERNSLR